MEIQDASPSVRSGRRAGARVRLAFALVAAAAVVLPLAEPASATSPSVVVAVGGRNDGAPACDPGRSVSSFDAGVSWPISATTFSPTSAPCVSGGELYDVASNGNVMLAVGTKQMATGTQGVSFRSVNGGLTWTAVGTIPPTPAGALAFEAVATDGAGRWVAGGASNGSASPSGLYYSDNDGATWTPATTGLPPTYGYHVHDIAERPGATTSWVAVGSVNSAGLTAAFTMASSNGSSWALPSTWGTNRNLSLNGVAIHATGTVVAVGSSRAPAAGPNLNAPLILVKASGAGTYALWQAQYLADTTIGGLNAVGMDPQGNTIMVGNKAVGSSTTAVAYRLPGSPTASLPNLSGALPPTIESLEDIANDQLGTWVVVGGDQGATSRSTDSGATWSPEVTTTTGQKGRGLLRGVTFRA